MDFIKKIEIQTEKITETKPLEKNIIINSCPVTVDNFNGHTKDFLPLDGKYDDGFTPIIHT